MLQSILQSIDFTKIVEVLLLAVLGVICKWIKQYAIPWVKTKLKDSTISRLVLTAEQLYKNGVFSSGEEKLNYVLEQAVKKLSSIGITIDIEEIEQVANSYVMEYFNTKSE